MKKRAFIHPAALLAVLCLSLLCALLQPNPARAQEEQKLYTAYNIWLLRGYNLKFINFKYGQEFIPAGTEVKKIWVQHRISDAMNSSPDVASYSYVTFSQVDNNKSHRIYFDDRYHPNKSIDDYRALTFTTKDLAELTKGFTEDELNAISKGTVVDGMSREAVLVSYGYPPEHRTKLQSANTWTYWLSKRQQQAVNFDESGYTFNTGTAATGQRKKTIKSSPGAEAPNKSPDDLLERLKVLSELKSQGLISTEEYEQKKKELLKRL